MFARQLLQFNEEQFVVDTHVALNKLELRVCPNGHIVVFAKQLVQLTEEQLAVAFPHTGIGMQLAFKADRELRVNPNGQVRLDEKFVLAVTLANLMHVRLEDPGGPESVNPNGHASEQLDVVLVKGQLVTFEQETHL